MLSISYNNNNKNYRPQFFFFFRFSRNWFLTRFSFRHAFSKISIVKKTNGARIEIDQKSDNYFDKNLINAWCISQTGVQARVRRAMARKRYCQDSTPTCVSCGALSAFMRYNRVLSYFFSFLHSLLLPYRHKDIAPIIIVGSRLAYKCR